MAAELLPTSVPKETRNIVFHNGVPWIPIFCANCGCDGGKIPEDAKDFAFYLCQPCADKWEPLANMMLVPDEVYWDKVNAAMVEKYGRVLEAHEQIELLKDGESILSKFARDRHHAKLI